MLFLRSTHELKTHIFASEIRIGVFNAPFVHAFTFKNSQRLSHWSRKNSVVFIRKNFPPDNAPIMAICNKEFILKSEFRRND